MLYAFFWVIPRSLKFICRRFGTLFHLNRQVGVCRMNWVRGAYLLVKMEQTECSERLVYKIQTPGNYPKESTQHLEQGEILK
jgi:hypothetical protein